MTRVTRLLHFAAILAFTLLLVVPAVAYAQGKSDDLYGGYAAGADAARLDDELNGEGTISKTHEDSSWWMVDQIMPISGKTTLLNISDARFQERVRSSALGKVTEISLAMFRTPPADTQLWAMDMGQTLGFIPNQAYAQGIGFSGLAPLLPVWKAFRNIAYLLLALVMIVIGFMVMFRKKIDPQTVVTVQNALPRIVVTLLLITFSYAIVGILIDLMYLVILLVVSILAPMEPTIFGPNTASEFVSSGFMRVWQRVFGSGFRALDDIYRFLAPGSVNIFQGDANLPGTSGLGEGVVAVVQTIVGGIGTAIGAIVLMLILLFATIRIFFMLISAYIGIITSLVFAPLQILMDAIPGGEGFSTWIRTLVSNLIVFPVTIALLMLTIILGRATGVTGGENVAKLWSPPLLFPGQYGLGGIIGLGMLMSIPAVVKSLKEAFKAQQGPVGAGSILAPVGGAIGTGMQGLYQVSFISHSLGGMLGKLGIGGDPHKK